MLELRWREKIARFKAPASATEGFGMTLISRVIEAELGGQIERNITKQGWEIRISIPSLSADL
jgi:two-component sensor histidine kinase